MSIYSKIIDLQKLSYAWERVRKNKPASGVDNVTYEQFDHRMKEELRQLNIELTEHRYKALPVKKVVLYKGEKAREIALYSMRDKVVQQSVAYELNRIYDTRFSEQTYAYRSNKSALNAVNAIDEQIRSSQYTYIMKTDIVHFFDTIHWESLRSILYQTIKEEDVLFLIEENSKSAMLEDTGELIEKSQGIYQGSAISPILSNIYLMDFDNWLAQENIFYVRYADDMMLLGNSKEELLSLLKAMRLKLQILGLEVNESKTSCVPIEEGINFLGYHFSSSGKAIPEKAEQELHERLEMMWLTSADISIEDKLARAIEIIGGWEQYFREQREIHSIFEFVSLISVAQSKKECIAELEKMRLKVENVYKDIAEYLADIWRSLGNSKMELLEYEQYYQIWSQDDKLEGTAVTELLEQYRKLMILEDKDTLIEIMQLYTDRREYEKAAFWMQKSERLNDSRITGDVKIAVSQQEEAIIFDQATARRIMGIFVGREDIFNKDTVGYGGKREEQLQVIPISEKIIMEHLNGKDTIATYIQRPNSTVKFLVIDIDISKKIMLQIGRESDEFTKYMEMALKEALEILKLLEIFGMRGYIEYSGCRGYHVWVLFTEWVPVRYVNMLTEVIESKLHKENEDCITIEFFPNKTRIRQGKFGQAIKLPFGVHARTCERSYFLDENLDRITELNTFMDNIAKVSLGAIKKVLAAYIGMKEAAVEKTVDNNLDVFGEITENIKGILENCNLMRYLCQKAAKTGYLAHNERLSVLYIFGHLGKEGCEFVHQIMSYTLNYNYNTTEKFIMRIPQKPVSCIKLREQYKQITAEYGCSCNFKRSKNCYPSPILHVISLSNDIQPDVTLPTSKTLSKENEKKVIDEINVHKKAQELATKILGLKKQRRGIDSAILKVEKELEKIYDNAGVDCLEVEMGMLVRRKTEQGYEWIIEI